MRSFMHERLPAVCSLPPCSLLSPAPTSHLPFSPTLFIHTAGEEGAPGAAGLAMRRSRTAPTALGGAAALSAASLPAGLDQLPVDLTAGFASLPPLPLGTAATGLLPVGGAPLGLAGLSAPLPGTTISASLIGGSAGAAAAAAMLAAADNAAAAAAGVPGGGAPALSGDAAAPAAITPTATPAVTPTAAGAAAAGAGFAAPFGAAALPQLPAAGAGAELAGMGQPKRSTADADLDGRFCQAVRLFGRDLKVRGSRMHCSCRGTFSLRHVQCVAGYLRKLPTSCRCLPTANCHRFNTACCQQLLIAPLPPLPLNRRCPTSLATRLWLPPDCTGAGTASGLPLMPLWRSGRQLAWVPKTMHPGQPRLCPLPPQRLQRRGCQTCSRLGRRCSTISSGRRLQGRRPPTRRQQQRQQVPSQVAQRQGPSLRPPLHRLTQQGQVSSLLPCRWMRPQRLQLSSLSLLRQPAQQRQPQLQKGRSSQRQMRAPHSQVRRYRSASRRRQAARRRLCPCPRRPKRPACCHERSSQSCRPCWSQVS